METAVFTDNDTGRIICVKNYAKLANLEGQLKKLKG